MCTENVVENPSNRQISKLRRMNLLDKLRYAQLLQRKQSMNLDVNGEDRTTFYMKKSIKNVSKALTGIRKNEESQQNLLRSVKSTSFVQDKCNSGYGKFKTSLESNHKIHDFNGLDKIDECEYSVEQNMNLNRLEQSDLKKDKKRKKKSKSTENDMITSLQDFSTRVGSATQKPQLNQGLAQDSTPAQISTQKKSKIKINDRKSHNRKRNQPEDLASQERHKEKTDGLNKMMQRVFSGYMKSKTQCQHPSRIHSAQISQNGTRIRNKLLSKNLEINLNQNSANNIVNYKKSDELSDFYKSKDYLEKEKRIIDASEYLHICKTSKSSRTKSTNTNIIKNQSRVRFNFADLYDVSQNCGYCGEDGSSDAYYVDQYCHDLDPSYKGGDSNTNNNTNRKTADGA